MRRRGAVVTKEEVLPGFKKKAVPGQPLQLYNRSNIEMFTNVAVRLWLRIIFAFSPEVLTSGTRP